ncbi:hypothetical protein [Metabacillus halosaccharovorans]|uniref:hypothetical protein n=1 Tax=Metabacillus halosaccharovorans TaxID=930124 RepID=UPI000995DA77|nr:hypothetical protein [Metabacillus halosaccharovorans]
MLRIIEWIGYIICLGSVLANGLIRHNGNPNTLWDRVTFFSVFVGTIITIVAFLFRKYGGHNKENRKEFMK